MILVVLSTTSLTSTLILITPNQAEKQLDPFFDNLTFFDFSPQIFLLVTSKMDRDGRNLHIARSFFHCYTMISSLAKVMGLQSTLLLEKTEDQKCEHTEYMILGFYKMHSS